jgi:hypothetical protein
MRFNNLLLILDFLYCDHIKFKFPKNDIYPYRGFMSWILGIDWADQQYGVSKMPL